LIKAQYINSDENSSIKEKYGISFYNRRYRIYWRLSSKLSLRKQTGSSTKKFIATETTEYDWETNKINSYQYTKYLSEVEAVKANNAGLKVFIVNPSVVLGKGAQNRQLIKMMKLAKSKIFIKTPGGTNIVHVKDVIEGIIKVISIGNSGERYILSGENVPYNDLFLATASLYGVKQFQIYLPFIQKIVPPIKKLFTYAYYSSRKAEQELEWIRDFGWEEALAETYHYMESTLEK